MAIGGGKRKWRNAVGCAGSLVAAAGVKLSVYRHDEDGGRGEGFCDVGMVRVFFFLF